jgi:hypothetical protein
MTTRLRWFLILSALLIAVAFGACGGSEEPVAQDSSTSEIVPTAKIPALTSTSVPATSTPRPTSTVVPSSTPPAAATLAPTATGPVLQSTATAVPTAVPTSRAVPTAVPTSTPVPIVTPTLGPPTPTPTATPIGYSAFTGSGTVETESFTSPSRLPWLVEWEAKGTAANSIEIFLMDPESGTEVNMIVDDSGTGQIGGANLVQGNIGTFYLRVEGPDAGWEIWIYQDFR